MCFCCPQKPDPIQVKPFLMFRGNLLFTATGRAEY